MKTEEQSKKRKRQKQKPGDFWTWAAASVLFRLVLIYFPKNLNLSSRPEVSTPLTSLRRLAEGYLLKQSSMSPYADIAALVYLWNPFTTVACVGLSTSPIENFAIILALYGACKRLVPLAAFGWVIATHLSLYPMILIIPMILLLGYGPDTSRKLLLLSRYGKVEDNSSSDSCQQQEKVINQSELPRVFSWRRVGFFLLWAIMWSAYLLFLCGVSAKQYGDLWEMFERMYGFILTVQDLSPNIGVLWYFFAEVFDFVRNFFLIVFQMNILFVIIPLAIRLKHRPCFLAFVYITISSMLKSYPSVGDSAMYFGLLMNCQAKMQFSFCLFSVYVGISLLSPVVHNPWIWTGTGNVNFYFATAITCACLQIVLVIESVSAMLNHDRKLRKLSNTKIHVDRS